VKVSYSKSAKKYLENLDSNTKKLIREGIDGLKESPPKGDIKPLHGSLKGFLRLRIGQYRIVFKYTLEKRKKKLVIDDIGTRGNIYK
jgi:mRNA interferase RelE/StbE